MRAYAVVSRMTFLSVLLTFVKNFRCNLRVTDHGRKSAFIDVRFRPGAERKQGLLESCPSARYSISRDACTMNVDGIVIPSAFAVLMLTTKSNRIACSTGRSPGLAPFRILSTNTAACR